MTRLLVRRMRTSTQLLMVMLTGGGLLSACSLFEDDKDDTSMSRFEGEVLETAPITLTGYRSAVAWGDINDDGIVDMLVTNDDDTRGSIQLHWGPWNTSQTYQEAGIVFDLPVTTGLPVPSAVGDFNGSPGFGAQLEMRDVNADGVLEHLLGPGAPSL